MNAAAFVVVGLIAVEIAVVVEEEIGAIEAHFIIRSFSSTPAVIRAFVILIQNILYLVSTESDLSVVIGDAILHGYVPGGTGTGVNAESDRVIPEKLVAVDQNILSINHFGPQLRA